MADGSVGSAVMAGVTYKPLFGRVLIKREIKEKSAGGIIIPDARRHAKCSGTVVAKGPTADESITIGSTVIFGQHAGKWLDGMYSVVDNAKDDAPFFICLDEDILLEVEQ